MTTAPPVGCSAGRPEVGRVLGRSRSARAGPRTAAGGCPPGPRARAAARRARTGTRAGRNAARCAHQSRARSATHSSIVVSPSGTNGITSTAPRRGCWPSWTFHVDARESLFDCALHGHAHAVCSTGEGQHAAIVVAIRRSIEQVNAGDARHARGDGVDDRQVTAFAEVGHTFDELGHMRAQVYERGPRQPVPHGTELCGVWTLTQMNMHKVKRRLDKVKASFYCPRHWGPQRRVRSSKCREKSSRIAQSATAR